MMRINLLPTARRNALARLIRIKRWAVAIGTGAAILAGSLATARIAWPDERADLRTVQAALQANQLDIVANVAALNDRVKRKKEALHTASKISDRPDWSILLALIADRTQKHIVLTHLTIEPAPPILQPTNRTKKPSTQEQPHRTLILRGVGTSAHQVSLFSVRLEDLSLFERVVIEQSARSQSGQLGSIDFTIRCRLPKKDNK